MIRGSVLWEELFSTAAPNKSRRVMLQALLSFSRSFIPKKTSLTLHYYCAHSLFSVRLGGDDREQRRLTMSRLAKWCHHCEPRMPLSREETGAFVGSYAQLQIVDMSWHFMGNMQKPSSVRFCEWINHNPKRQFTPTFNILRAFPDESDKPLFQVMPLSQIIVLCFSVTLWEMEHLGWKSSSLGGLWLGNEQWHKNETEYQ